MAFIDVLKNLAVEYQRQQREKLTGKTDAQRELETLQPRIARAQAANAEAQPGLAESRLRASQAAAEQRGEMQRAQLENLGRHQSVIEKLAEFKAQLGTQPKPMAPLEEELIRSQITRNRREPAEAAGGSFVAGEEGQFFNPRTGQVVQAPAGFSPKPSTAVANRQESAKAALDVSGSAKQYIRDNAAVIGPIVGRYNSLAQAAGTGDPRAVRLVAMLRSYAALQPNIHGFRAVAFAQHIEELLNTKQTPEALLAGIEGIDEAARAVIGKRPDGGGGAAGGAAGTGGIDPAVEKLLKEAGL